MTAASLANLLGGNGPLPLESVARGEWKRKHACRRWRPQLCPWQRAALCRKWPLQKFSRGVRTKARLPAQQALSRGSDAADARVLLVRSPRRPQPAAAQPQLRPVPASAATETQSHLLQNRPQLPLRNQQDIKRQGGGMSRARPCRPHSQPLHSSNCDPSLRRRTETDGTKSSSPQTFAGNHHRTANVD